MGKETITVEGRTLEVYDRSLDSNYAVFDNKIWKWFSKEGMGNNFTIGFEKPLTKEIVYLKGEQLKKVKWVITRTGYMNI